MSFVLIILNFFLFKRNLNSTPRISRARANGKSFPDPPPLKIHDVACAVHTGNKFPSRSLEILVDLTRSLKISSDLVRS